MRKLSNLTLLTLIILVTILLVKLSLPSDRSQKLTQETKFYPTAAPTIESGLDSDKLWSLIQDWRKSQGLSPYIKDQRLCDIAIDRADDGKDYHKGFYNKYSNYPYVIQENQVWDATADKIAIDWWLNSKPHRATLEKSYAYSCIETYKNNAVQIFSNFQP